MPDKIDFVNNKNVSLVIPGRNCARTIRSCLEAVVPLLRQPGSLLEEIIFVDDGSTDETKDIVAEFPVTCLAGLGQGPGSARNLGWRDAKCPLVWFIDSDCVAEPDALSLLLSHLEDSKVGGVGGSYGTMTSDSLLSCLIHEEIVERHRSMDTKVNFLATFNVIYRREILEQIGGFDERFLKGQDAELAFRVIKAGYELRFEFNSKVRHYHPTQLSSYLKTQRQQGYWRVWLHLSHGGHALGDSYSSVIDHGQPPLAMLVLITSPLVVLPYARWVPAGLVVALIAAQLPLTLRLTRRLKKARYLCFGFMSFIRAFWRGIGMTHGMFGYVGSKLTTAK
ncbi:MAG: glycosyltransferase [Phycisphaerales bacterium]|nr:glycosyltransferase [Phycisphaerales bacterium]